MEPGTSTGINSLEPPLEHGRHAAMQGDFPEALGFLDRAVEQNGHDWEAWRLRGLVHLRLGQPMKAVADLERATEGLDMCAACHHELGNARLRAGNLEAALSALERALDLDQRLAGAHAMRAAVLLRLHRAEEALEAMNAAISLEPDDTGMLHNRAVVLGTLGKLQEASRDYEAVLRLKPKSGGTLNNLAWLLATAPDPTLRDGSRALALAHRAVATGRTGAWLDTLAAAYAESGDFDAAVKTETEALELSRPSNPTFQERINIYRQRITFAAWRARRAESPEDKIVKKKEGYHDAQ